MDLDEAAAARGEAATRGEAVDGTHAARGVYSRPACRNCLRTSDESGAGSFRGSTATEARACEATEGVTSTGSVAERASCR